MLISGRPLNFEREALTGKVRQDAFVQHQVTVGPGFERKPTREPANGALLCLLIIEPNNNHCVEQYAVPSGEASLT
jgi:hypothetical protein